MLSHTISTPICQLNCTVLAMSNATVGKISLFITKLTAKQEINIGATFPEAIQGHMQKLPSESELKTILLLSDIHVY